jgi:hypothetical protein
LIGRCDLGVDAKKLVGRGIVVPVDAAFWYAPRDPRITSSVDQELCLLRRPSMIRHRNTQRHVGELIFCKTISKDGAVSVLANAEHGSQISYSSIMQCVLMISKI